MNTVYVFEKPLWKNKILENMNVGDNPLFDYFGQVFNADEPYLLFHQHADGAWYNRGRRTSMSYLTFDRWKDVPLAPRYIADFHSTNSLHGRQMRNLKSDLCRKIQSGEELEFVFLVYGDGADFFQDDVLAAGSYIERFGLDSNRCFVMCALYEKYAVGDKVPFVDVWEKMIATWCRPTHDDVDNLNRFNQIANWAGKSKKWFSDYFGISYRTIQNWSSGISAMPEWAPDLFIYKLEHEGII